MGNFFAELKRRHIYRVAAAYAVVAWLLLQLVNNVAPILDLPPWVARAFLLALVVGFPLVIFFAWMRELPPSDAAAPMRATITDWALIGVLVVVIALMSYGQFSSSQPTVASQPSLEAARIAAAKPTGISVAVLPFVNLSSDKEQEFFSDGMTEEITSALAKVSGLNVVARTSAFQFKGENKDMRAIGEALGASHLIEGSVRKDGNEVRITAQLIRAGDGTHLWTESYDRELKGIFAIQEDIAKAIAVSLSVPLGLKAGQTLVSNRTTDTDSYQDYLRARALVRVRSAPLRTEAAKLLEQVVARDPNYAPAWGMLGQAYASIAFLDITSNRPALLQKAEAAGQQAIRLDPSHTDGYAALALARNYLGQFLQAEDLYKQALALDPGNPEALHQYSFMLALVGRLKDSLAMRLRLEVQEPSIPLFTSGTTNLLAVNGRNDEAIARYKKVLPAQASPLASLYASMGRYSDAAEALREIPLGNFPPGALEEAIRLLNNAPAQTASTQANLGPGLAFVYLYTGTPDRALEPFENNAELGLLGHPGAGFLWGSSYAPIRKTERFKAFVRKIGLVDYWKARGWPEFCHPTTNDDFECH